METVTVRLAREGLRVPKTPYTPERFTMTPETVELSTHVVRRLRDGDLVEVKAEPSPPPPSDEPDPQPRQPKTPKAPKP